MEKSKRKMKKKLLSKLEMLSEKKGHLRKGGIVYRKLTASEITAMWLNRCHPSFRGLAMRTIAIEVKRRDSREITVLDSVEARLT